MTGKDKINFVIRNKVDPIIREIIELAAVNDPRKSALKSRLWALYKYGEAVGALAGADGRTRDVYERHVDSWIQMSKMPAPNRNSK